MSSDAGERSGNSGADKADKADKTDGAQLQPGRKRSRDGTRLPHSDVLLDRYMQRDSRSVAALNDQTKRAKDLVRAKAAQRDYLLRDVRHARQANPAAVFGPGFSGYGNGVTDAKSFVLYNQMRPPPRGRRFKTISLSRKDVARQAELHEELVPVRLDIELDKLRLRDTFTWNLHERIVSPDLFVHHLMEDLCVPPEAAPEVVRQALVDMKEQIRNFYPHVLVDDAPLEAGRPYTEYKDDDMRIPIKLNITIGRVTLVDQFEWDINNPLNSPEEFARQMAVENALSGEFTTAIAHSIREQSQLYTRSLYLTNHPFDGRPIEDPDLRDAFMPGPILNACRPQQMQKDWTPFMYEMSDDEYERTETSMMREHRAQKRQHNRRGGPALPDLRDRPRTVRSLIIHSVIPGAVETFEATGMLKTRPSRGGRRTGRDMDMDSDEMESEESTAESPPPMSMNTLRTRGRRPAASAAQLAMRAGYGRSATPDSQLLDPRPSRRSVYREDSVANDGDTLIVKLKINKAKFRSWWERYRAIKRASELPLSGYV
ncbi:SNF5-domain-containing protein [Piedraia hortae CBS 480.64]|uniref:SNF5-domain-containing protein n=1 Tax=Piedraia hortae CBS 480.64 TaxID=1314780 RepID=A0A6A7C4W5_9PEZI|nr:SNF5-domain-containing protein [Piedraia hortae CBS 480.64]